MCSGDCLGHGESRIDKEGGTISHHIVCGCGKRTLKDLGASPYRPDPTNLGVKLEAPKAST